MSRESGQAVRAVFLAAIMVISVFAVGVSFSGSAAAEVTEISDLTAENVRAGESIAGQDVTLTDVNNTQGQLGDITIDFEGNPDIIIKSVELVGSGDFGDESVDVGARNAGGIFVTIDESATATSNITIQVTLDTTNATPGTVTYTADAVGGATASGDFRVEVLGIEHDPNTAGTTFGSSFHAEDLRIASANGNSISFGSGSTFEFRIENSSGNTVTVEPQSGEPTVDAEEFEFEIYDGKGAIDDTAKVFAGGTEINVTVSDDTGMFAAGVAADPSSTSDPFEEYTVSLVDASGNDVIDSTDPRLIAIGYNKGSGVTQNSTTGNIRFTIPRASLNEGFDENWSAAFSISNNSLGTRRSASVANNAGADTFYVTANATDVPAGKYTASLELYRTEQPSNDSSDRIINIIEINGVTIESTDSAPAPAPTVDVENSSITPSETTAGETQEYTVDVTIDNVPNEAATVDILVDDFTILDDDGNVQDDASLDYSAADVNDGTATFTATFNATAPNTPGGSGGVAVTEIRSEDGNDVIYDDFAEIDTIDIQGAGGDGVLTVAADGSAEFDTIEQAIAEAESGDTVEVRPGTYTEPVDINKNITLVAPDGATVENSSAPLNASSSYRHGIQVFGPTTPTVKGFTIVDWTTGFSAGASEGAWTLQDTVIRDSRLGVGGAGTPAPWTVDNVTVVNATYGLSFYQSSGDWMVRNSTFRRTGGISGDESSGNWVVEQTTIRNSTDDAIDAVNSSGQWTIRDSVVTDTADNGIAADETSGDWTLVNVTVSDVEDDAVDAYESDGNWTVRRTTVTDASDEGINGVSSSGDWEVRDTVVTETDDGVDSYNSTGNWTVRDTRITDVSDEGIDAVSSTGDWEVRDTVVTSAADGVNGYNSTGDWTVRDTRIRNVSTHGIDAYASGGDWTVTNATIRNVSANGVYAENATGAWEVHESVVLNTSRGINATNATVEGNATRNYWGSADGPSGDFSGSGQAAVGNLTVEPFYIDAALTTLDTFESTGNPVVNDSDPAAFDTIQQAVDEAEDGDVVEVTEGTYDTFDINTNSVTVTAVDNRSETVISLNSSERVDIGGSTDDVEISGFTFTFEEQAVYDAGNSRGTQILDNRFELRDSTESQGYAVRFEGGTSDSVARGNEFVGINNTVTGEFGNGIIVSGPDGHVISNNTFAGNSIGVNVSDNQPAGTLQITDNTFTGHDDFAIALNHDDSESPDIDITENQITSNEVGVLVRSGGSIGINQNDIVGNAEAINATFLSDGTVTATENWWGSANGPDAGGNNTYNDSNQGDEVTDNVEFTPWLDAGTANGGQPFAPIESTDSGGQFASIQRAVDAADEDETIELRTGTFTENIRLDTRNVTVSGQHDLFNGIEGTVIEGRVSLTAPETEIRRTKIAPPTFADDPDGENAINVTASNVTSAVNVTASAAVVDDSTINITSVASDGELRTAAVAVVEGGTETRDVTISDNHVRAEGISEGDGSVVANGVVDAGDTEKTLIVNNGIRVTSENTSAAVVSETLDGQLGSNGAPTSEVLLNEITATSEDGDGVGYAFAGPNEVAAEEQLVKYNVFRDIDAIEHGGAGGTLDLTVNRWRTDLDGVEFRTDPFDDPQFKGGDIVFDPVLTEEKSVEQLNNDELLRENENGELVATTRDYGSYIEIETQGEPTVIGFPARPAGSLAEILPQDAIEREDGEAVSIFVYDNAAGSFEPVNGSYVPDPGEVLVITTESGLSSDFVVPVATEPEGVAGTPSEVQLRTGWNLVATGAANSPRDPTIAGAEVVTAGQFQTQPRQPGAPPATVSAYDGTWVFVDDDGQLFTGYVENQPPAVYLERVLDPDSEDDRRVT
jgi:surface glycoprotein (TIGR04207 family)